MSAHPKPNEPHFVSIGDFSSRDANRLLAAFTDAAIAFQIECDDGIYSYPPTNAPNFGVAARIRIFVDRERLDEVQKLEANVLGDWRP